MTVHLLCRMLWHFTQGMRNATDRPGMTLGARVRSLYRHVRAHPRAERADRSSCPLVIRKDFHDVPGSPSTFTAFVENGSCPRNAEARYGLPVDTVFLGSPVL